VFVCLCHAVTESEVLSAVIDRGADTSEAVGEHTGAGTGCGSCLNRIEGILGACGKVCPLGDAQGRLGQRTPALAS
jgi:bacterioferritin-associated ferredoxin